MDVGGRCAVCVGGEQAGWVVVGGRCDVCVGETRQGGWPVWCRPVTPFGLSIQPVGYIACNHVTYLLLPHPNLLLPHPYLTPTPHCPTPTCHRAPHLPATASPHLLSARNSDENLASRANGSDGLLEAIAAAEAVAGVAPASPSTTGPSVGTATRRPMEGHWMPHSTTVV